MNVKESVEYLNFIYLKFVIWGKISHFNTNNNVNGKRLDYGNQTVDYYLTAIKRSRSQQYLQLIIFFKRTRTGRNFMNEIHPIFK